jgi:hypothetical protein
MKKYQLEWNFEVGAIVNDEQFLDGERVADEGLELSGEDDEHSLTPLFIIGFTG